MLVVPNLLRSRKQKHQSAKRHVLAVAGGKVAKYHNTTAHWKMSKETNAL